MVGGGGCCGRDNRINITYYNNIFDRRMCRYHADFNYEYHTHGKYACLDIIIIIAMTPFLIKCLNVFLAVLTHNIQYSPDTNYDNNNM